MATHWNADDVEQDKWRTCCIGLGPVGVAMVMSSAMGRVNEKKPELFANTGARFGLRVTEENVKDIAEKIVEQHILKYDGKPIPIDGATIFVQRLIGYEVYWI